MKKNLNQKLIDLIEYYNLINSNLLLSNTPQKRNLNNIVAASYKGTKFQKLEKLKKNIQLIKNCQLKKSATNLVFGDGNIDAKIMIVGEGPGAQEDAKGIPFVGRAGQLLDKMLESIQLNRTKVYISNVVNYRPPSNRRPTEMEIARYLPFLKSHIEIINPKILILLGSTALNTLIGNNEVISKARGKWIQKDVGSIRPWTIASFHPAFLLRQPDQKKMAWIDLKMVRDKLKSLRI
ncbi:MAG: uracil-DNA glycosylase [Pelagibacteraceae bacterium]|jgi:DNA polymerase|nr:uracil-DNA glycosylase [Pelagibacteraceae bacterium]MDP6710695.1 uracil-DNA glycosylase [Pelagibacteraceae bacterium]|tara:strand:+ start:1171 stop:1878 length:708 start_codon:yes stop_codon:yes gene_type:complete